MASEDRVLGRIGTTLKGEYDNNKTYTKLNQVTYQGGSYTLKVPKAKGILPTNEDCWICSARPGEKGDKGDKGEKGDTGVQGPQGEQGIQGIQGEQGEKGDKGDKPVSGVDYFTEEEKTEFKNAVVKDSKTEIDTHTADKITEFNNNATEKINTFNSNAEEKIAEYDAHAETLTNRITDLEEENSELAQQMPWNTTEIQESIYVADSAKYSKNKLSPFGNMTQETSETGNNIFDGIMELGSIDSATGKETNSSSIIRSKNYIDISNLTALRVIRSDGYAGSDFIVGFRFYDKDKNFIIYKAIALGSVIKLSDYTDLGDYQYIRFIVTNTADIETYKYGLNKDASLTFEDYIPTKPSVDYPSMPVVATGLQTVKKYSKNLCKSFINGNTYRYSAAFYLDCNLEKGKYYALSFTDLSVGNVYYRNENVVGSNGKYSDYIVTSTGKRQTWIFLCVENDKNKGGVYFKNKGYYFLKNSQQQEQQSNLVDVQLEEVTSLSSLATDYEPYNGEDITLDLADTELCKIGNSSDYIYKKSGIWYKHNRINKIILTGNETFNNNYGTHLFNTGSIPNTISQAGGVSNCYRYNKVQSKLDATMVNGEFAVQKTEYDNTTKIFFKNTNFSNASNFKQHLKDLYDANNPVVIYYPLENAIDEQITSESLIEQLEKIYKLKLEKGINNIFVESENGVTTELQLEYMQDNNLIQKEEHKALEDRITAIEALLSTTQTSALLLDNMQEDLEKEVE